jgi:DNA topoisomerase-1
VPICPIPGQHWGSIVHKHDTTWLCGYKDSIKGAHKYIFLAANSKFKGVNDRRKYEKARKLKKHIGEVRADYTRMLTHKEEVKRQLGTAVYLIDFLALRVGNEKGEDEADTQGTCSLRVEHIRV